MDAIALRMDQDGRRVAAAGVAQLPPASGVDPVPSGEEHVIVLLHREGVVEAGEDGGGIVKIGPRERRGAQHIDDTYGKKGRPHAMAAYIQQVEGEMVVVEPMIAEGVPAQLRGGHKDPVRCDRAMKPLRKHRPGIGRRLGEFGRHDPVGLFHLLLGEGKVGGAFADRPLEVGVPLGEAFLPEADFPGHRGETAGKASQFVVAFPDAIKHPRAILVGAALEIGGHRLQFADRPGNPACRVKNNGQQKEQADSPDGSRLGRQRVCRCHDELVGDLHHQLPAGVLTLRPVDHLAAPILESHPSAATGQNLPEGGDACVQALAEQFLQRGIGASRVGGFGWGGRHVLRLFRAHDKGPGGGDQVGRFPQLFWHVLRSRAHGVHRPRFGC